MKTIFALLALCLASIVSAQNVLVNGSFEQNGVGFTGNGIYNNIPTGTTSLPGWNVIGTLDLYGNLWVAEAGLYSLDMAGSPSIGNIAQTFATTIGQQYQVTFWMSGNPMYNEISESPIMTMKVSVDTVSNNYSWNVQTMGNTLSNMMWQEQSFIYTATASSDTIDFLSTEGDRFTGIALDNVAVAAVVPEPSSATLLLVGLAGILTVRSRCTAR